MGGVDRSHAEALALLDHEELGRLPRLVPQAPQDGRGGYDLAEPMDEVLRSLQRGELYQPLRPETIDAIVGQMGVKREDRIKPRIISSQIITGIDGHQSQLINRMRHGDMIVGGQTLYILEGHPAGYAALAANEAEKRANLNILEVRAIGSFGRIYLGGDERDIMYFSITYGPDMTDAVSMNFGPLNLEAVQNIQLLPFFDFTWVENRGISLGIAQAQNETHRWILVAVTAAIFVALAFRTIAPSIFATW